MDKFQCENLEKLLDKGLTLIEARQFDKSLFNIIVEDCEYVSLTEAHYPNDYFAPIHDGVEYFTFDKIGKYKNLPDQGIILKDGTIFNVNTFHMEESCWLKYNGIDLISGTKAWKDNNSRKIGSDNIYTIDHALKKIPTQDLYR